MRPTHVFGITALLGCFALAGVVYTQSAAPRESPMAHPAAIGEKGSFSDFLATDSDIEGTRTIQLIIVAGPSSPFNNFVIGPDQEIDVTTIHMQNGRIADQTLRSGGFRVFDGVGPAWYFVQPEFGSRTFNLDPPLKLREGASVRYLEGNDPESEGYLDIVLHGRPPSGKTGIVLR